MGDAEFERPQSDFEVEITDLDELDTVTSPSRPEPRRKFSPRQRWLQLTAINGVLILAMVIILASTAAVRGLVSSVSIRPTPSPIPTLGPGVDLFYVRGDPAWGRLFIDGHPTALPDIGTDPPLRLARGQHLLTWQAAPFLTQQCTVSVPPSLTDTCSDHEAIQFNTGPYASVISISVSLATLSGARLVALLQAAQAALDARQSTDTVRPGEHYALAPDNPTCKNPQCYATASQPLRATLSFQLDTNEASNKACIDPQPGVCVLNNQNCRLFCTNTFLTSPATQEWVVFAPVLSLWTFTTMNGQVLARDVPDDSSWYHATGQTLDESLVQLSITWDSRGWHVGLSVNLDSQGAPYPGYFDPACAAMTHQLSLSPPVVNGAAASLQWQFASGTLPAAGCVAVGLPQPDDFTTPAPSHSPQPVFYYLHRFGVLLAVN